MFFKIVVGGFDFFVYLCHKIKKAMASKRELKRNVKAICNDLLSECVAAYLYNGRIAPENSEALIRSVIGIRNDFVSRIAHPEPGMAAQAYFGNLQRDFNKQLYEVIDQITNLCE